MPATRASRDALPVRLIASSTMSAVNVSIQNALLSLSPTQTPLCHNDSIIPGSAEDGRTSSSLKHMYESSESEQDREASGHRPKTQKRKPHSRMDMIV